MGEAGSLGAVLGNFKLQKGDLGWELAVQSPRHGDR